LSEFLPRFLTAEQLKSLKQEKDFNLEHYNFLMRIPGGKGLFDRLKAE
jgi:hypothetical protein